ncbi:hypothetical protein T11_12891 [Trichinella zimbabwensis]|uniref:Uncharacterized protein n=1 Tax=Trichinella zimbabwensis TaxID=268475 RepID=A0A0V1GMP2_9BILA|nr:hypothetical protein T11_12891 [Trichinella zimbabwensis]
MPCISSTGYVYKCWQEDQAKSHALLLQMTMYSHVGDRQAHSKSVSSVMVEDVFAKTV